MKKLFGALMLSLGAASFQLQAADMEDTIKLTSTAFTHHSTVPLKYSAYGDNISPQLSWSNIPAGTEQLVLVMDDPIAPTPQPFVHWVAYNIPADATGLPENLSKDAKVAGIPELDGMTNGLNGMRQVGYFGPRPPKDDKLHAYHFRIYALDSKLDLAEGLNKQGLLDAIEGHVLGTGMLMGHYQQE